MLSKREERYLERAVGVALTSTQKYRHGCIIVKNGKVVSVATNDRRNNPNICSFPKAEAGIHAEQWAIKKSNTDLRGATLFVARVGRSGNPLLSKPCPACQKAIDSAGIKKVFYTE